MDSITKFIICTSIAVAVLTYIADLPYLSKEQQAPIVVVVSAMFCVSGIAAVVKYSDLTVKQSYTPLVCLYSNIIFSLCLLLTSSNQNSPLPVLIGVFVMITFLATIVRLLNFNDD